MSALEQEIIEKFHRLEPAAQQRVLASLSAETHTAFDYEAWWSQVRSLQTSLQAHLGVGNTVGALSLLDELREEAS